MGRWAEGGLGHRSAAGRPQVWQAGCVMAAYQGAQVECLFSICTRRKPLALTTAVQLGLGELEEQGFLPTVKVRPLLHLPDKVGCLPERLQGQ